MGITANDVGEKSPRGFESLLLRPENLVSDDPST